MTEGGGTMDESTEGEVLASHEVEVRVSPVRVCFKPRITPTEPKPRFSTSSGCDAYSSRSLETRSRCWLLEFTKTLWRPSVPKPKEVHYIFQALANQITHQNIPLQTSSSLSSYPSSLSRQAFELLRLFELPLSAPC